MSPSPAEVAAHIPKLQVISCLLLRRRFHARNILPLRLRKRGEAAAPTRAKNSVAAVPGMQGLPKAPTHAVPSLLADRLAPRVGISNPECWLSSRSVVTSNFMGDRRSSRRCLVPIRWSEYLESVRTMRQQRASPLTVSDWPCYFRILSPVRREYYDWGWLVFFFGNFSFIIEVHEKRFGEAFGAHLYQCSLHF
jgi:hypothetical protein